MQQEWFANYLASVYGFFRQLTIGIKDKFNRFL